MTVEASFENFIKDNSELMVLKDADVMSAILVGPRDFILRGKKSEIIQWLTAFNKPIKTSKGYGKHVNIILNTKVDKAREITTNPYCSNTNSTFKKNLNKFNNPLNKVIEIRFSTTEDKYQANNASKTTRRSIVRVDSNFTSRYSAGIVSLMS